MSTLNDFNIIGKIDSSKTVITPSEFIFKLKEINAINNIEYEKLKTILNDKTISLPTKDWIEQEKDKKFQSLFKQLWPNIYSSINSSEPKPVQQLTTAELIAELEKKRAIADLVARQEMEKHKAALLKDSLESNYSNVYSSKYNDTLNICINGLNTSKIEIKTNPLPQVESKPHYETHKYPNLASSYDFSVKSSHYLDKIVTSPYNPNEFTKEAQLIKSIKESQEKIKMNQKLEKTTDLVDDIIGKVQILQNEMKKKSESYKLMNSLELLKKEHEEKAKKEELLKLLENELEKKKYCHLNHHHRHVHRSREFFDSDSENETKPKNSIYLNSILKNHKPRVSFTYPLTNHETRYARSKSPNRLKRSKSYVSHHKVDCWNLNCSHDSNIY